MEYSLNEAVLTNTKMILWLWGLFDLYLTIQMGTGWKCLGKARGSTVCQR